VSKNEHRWKEWIEDDRVREILEGVAKSLERAWTLDKKSPKNFPINTWWLFVQVQEQLKDKPSEDVGIKVRTPRIPEKLSDLIAEPTIKGAYEDHNEGSYEDALKLAAVGYDEGYAAWRKIWRALDVAYMTLHYSIDSAPMPRVHYLHRKLFEFADSEYLRGQSLEGLVEFFDDICPCGKTHKPDALRKLKKRISKSVPPIEIRAEDLSD
jgi:hypothetical protein